MFASCGVQKSCVIIFCPMHFLSNEHHQFLLDLTHVYLYLPVENLSEVSVDICLHVSVTQCNTCYNLKTSSLTVTPFCITLQGVGKV